MKIKTKELSYEEILKLPKRQHKNPLAPSKALKKLVLAISDAELKKVGFSYEGEGMEKLKKDEPCLIVMNHSSFIDLKIAETIFKDRPLQIVCTSDGFVGKEWIMRHIGCIPTQKFVTDLTLVKDMKHCVDKLRTSILLYPEASYSFDGTATPLPESLCKFVKLLNVPVVFIETFGAFHRDPLYNGLRLRDVKVTAKVTYLLSPDDIQNKPAAEIAEVLNKSFSFDYFKWQKDNKIAVSEDFRTLGLERVLYKCPCCKAEGHMKGTGVSIICEKCGSSFYMNEFGEMSLESIGNKATDTIKTDNIEKIKNEAGIVKNEDGFEFKFTHIPDWYRWQRECVIDEIKKDEYRLDIPVDVKILKDFNAIYEVGEGRPVHDGSGFSLKGCNGMLDYVQAVKSSYSLYSDYFWYELGDMICIGDNKILYYCFPKTDNVVVAKARLATEEMYKMAH